MSTQTPNPLKQAISLSQTQGEALAKFDGWFEQARKYYTGYRAVIADDVGDIGEPPPAPVQQVQQVFRIFGFAGSGKTTIAARKAQDLGGGILAATFTGKASLVMRRKGFDCSTIHSLIYIPKMVPVLDDAGQPTGEEKLDFVLNEDSPLLSAKLLVVDEVSMVNAELAKDLLSFNRPILVLGDPGQLPPVSGTGYFTQGTPDVMLTEIHRQALDNPIIKLSMDVRLGRGCRPGMYGESKVIRRELFNAVKRHETLSHDQVLCGTNRTRRGLNAQIRHFKGFEFIAQPEAKDKLICLRNNKRTGLFNGGMWHVDEPPQFDGEVFDLGLSSLDIPGLNAKVKVPLEFFTGEDEKLSAGKRRKYDEFDFGYAITVHKSQGSQWDSVLVVNENYCFRETAVQWLYTAITRAAERLTLVI